MLRVCPTCGLENIAARTLCKRCRASLAAIPLTPARPVVRRVRPPTTGQALMRVLAFFAGMYALMGIGTITACIMKRGHLADRWEKPVLLGVCAGIILTLAVVWRVLS